MPDPLQTPVSKQPPGSSTTTQPSADMSSVTGPALLRRDFLRAALAAAATSLITSPAAQAQGPAQSLAYDKALENITSKLDKAGDKIKIATKPVTSEELDTLVKGLITADGAPKWIAQMPEKFSSTRLTQMAENNYSVPYINHEGQLTARYSIFAEKAAANVQAAAQAAGLKVEGITPLDQPKALYAVAVTQADGARAWILAQVTEKFVPRPENGNGPAPAAIHSALPNIFGLLPK